MTDKNDNPAWDYESLARCLAGRQIGTYFQNPGLLVVSNTNPALPKANCFWVTMKDQVWYLGTWLPAIYEVGEGSDLCHICEQVFQSSATAIYNVEPTLALKLGLRRLSEEETDRAGF